MTLFCKHYGCFSKSQSPTYECTKVQRSRPDCFTKSLKLDNSITSILTYFDDGQLASVCCDLCIYTDCTVYTYTWW